MPLDLEQTQKLFWELSQAPEGCGEKLKLLKDGQDFPLKKLSEFIEEKKSGEALRRMDLYSQMYFWRIYESLEEDFPVLATLLGKKVFHEWVASYLQKYPSQSFDLALAGSRFPQFFLKKTKQDKGESWLGEMAQLEWQIIELGREKEASLLTQESLIQIPPEKWGEIELCRIPASRLLHCNYKILPLWKECRLDKNQSPAIDINEEECWIFLWRKHFDIEILEVEFKEAQLLNKVSEKTSFAKLCEEIEAEEAARWLQQWLNAGAFLFP